MFTLHMASRRTVWEAQRAAIRLRGASDNRFSAERRLWKKQLTELRREWEAEDIMKRRAVYLVQREEDRAIEARRVEREKIKIINNKAEEYAAREMMAAERRERVLRAKRRESFKRRAVNEDAATDFRRNWLEQIQNEQDISGTAGSVLGVAKRRPWIYPETIDAKMMSIWLQQASPVDKWKAVERTQLEEEEFQTIPERIRGKLQLAGEATESESSAVSEAADGLSALEIDELSSAADSASGQQAAAAAPKGSGGGSQFMADLKTAMSVQNDRGKGAGAEPEEK